MNYCCLIIYLINITINFFIQFNLLGLWVQTGSVTETMENASLGTTFTIAVIISLTVYYVVANVVCFYAYREFKGMLIDHQGGNGGFGMGGMRMPGGGGSGPQNAERVAEDRQGGGGGFSGQGQAIGGGGGPRGPPGNSAAASSGGGFKSFQGKGVQIGGS